MIVNACIDQSNPNLKSKNKNCSDILIQYHQISINIANDDVKKIISLFDTNVEDNEEIFITVLESIALNHYSSESFKLIEQYLFEFINLSTLNLNRCINKHDSGQHLISLRLMCSLMNIIMHHIQIGISYVKINSYVKNMIERLSKLISINDIFTESNMFEYVVNSRYAIDYPDVLTYFGVNVNMKHLRSKILNKITKDQTETNNESTSGRSVFDACYDE